MSEGGRPRRSAAAQNKVWASLMSNKSGGEDDIFEDAPEPTRKRGASKETSGKPPGEDVISGTFCSLLFCPSNDYIDSRRRFIRLAFSSVDWWDLPMTYLIFFLS